MIQNNINKDLERKIDLYINGRLSDEQIDDLWTELIQDDYYMDYMKSSANLKALIEESRELQKPTVANQIRKYAGYITAAAVVIFVGVIGVMNYSVENSSNISPIENIGLDIVRSEDGVSVDITNETLKRAIKLAADGNTLEAKKILSEGLDKISEPSLLAEFYITLGSINYNLGEYEQAVIQFERATNQEDIDVQIQEKGYWLLANSYFQLDRLTEAQQTFRITYELDGQYSRIAESYMKALTVITED